MKSCLEFKSQKIILIDPLTDEVVRKYIYFWNLPKNIYKILDEESFQKNSKVLIDYFGVDWKYYIGLSDEKESDQKNIKAVKEASSNPANKMSKLDFSSDEEFDFDNIAVDFQEDLEDISNEKDIMYFNNISIFPEDTVTELKEKIYISTGIPVYRQHIFHRNSGKSDTHDTWYEISIHGNNYAVSRKNDKENIQNIKVDLFLYRERYNTIVRTWETTDLLDNVMPNNIYLIDMNSYIQHIDKNVVSNDVYQLELIFYGLIKKYFPMLNYNMFQQYLMDENNIFHNYPLINKSRETLNEKYRIQSTISYRVWTSQESLMEKYKSEIDVTIKNIIFMSRNKINETPKSLNMRNMVNMFRCTGKFFAIEGTLQNNENWYQVTKQLEGSEDIIFEDYSLTLFDLKESLNIIFYVGDTDEIANMTIHASGKYLVQRTSQKFKTSFSEYFDMIDKDINHIIDFYNKYPDLTFNRNRTVKNIVKFNKVETEIASIDLSLLWKKSVSLDAFQKYENIINQYEKAGIISKRDNIYGKRINNYILKINRGITKFRIPFITKKNSESKDYYEIFRDGYMNGIWNMRNVGSKFDITKGVTNVIMDISDIDDISYSRAILYIVSLLYDFDDVKEVEKKQKSITNVKKKMEELDPELYKFQSDDGTKYARICQKKFRPTGVYTTEEYNSLPDKKNITKYYNYTRDEDIYYKCPDKYPILGFITGKHPDGYCIPRCKENETDGKKNKLISDICHKEHVFGKKIFDSNVSNIIKFGKSPKVDRLSYVHDSIYELFGIIKKDHLLMHNIDQDEGYMKRMIKAYALFKGVKYQAFASDLVGLITNDIYNKLNFTYYISIDDLKAVILEKSQMHPNMNWPEVVSDIIYYIYGDVIMIFETVITSNKEMLDESNSYINLLINDSININTLHKNNIILFIDLRDVIYPIMYKKKLQELPAKLISQIISFSKFKHKADPKSAMFNTYEKMLSILEKKNLEIKERFIYNSELIGLLLKGNKTFYIGVNNIIVKPDPQYKDIYDLFDRKKYKLDAKEAISLTNEFYNISNAVFICNHDHLHNIQVKEHNKKCNFIGFRIDDVYTWFDDTTHDQLKSIIDLPDISIEFMNYDPYEVNRVLSKYQEAANLDADLLGIHYNLYIYNLFKYEFYSLLQNYRNSEIRDDIANMKRKIKKIKNFKTYLIEKYPYSGKQIYNSLSRNDYLNNIILQEELIILADEIQKIDIHKFIKLGMNQICKFINKIPNIQPDNVLTSEIKVIADINISDQKIKVKYIDDINKQGLFYTDGKLNILKDEFDSLVDILAQDIKNKFNFLQDITHFNIYYINKYFNFDKNPNEKIIITSL